jgi:hypothetical protein
MAELLIMEFDGVTESDYRTVTASMGIDPDTGKGDWPVGLITHIAGMGEAGTPSQSKVGHRVRRRRSSCRTGSRRRRPKAG